MSNNKIELSQKQWNFLQYLYEINRFITAEELKKSTIGYDFDLIRSINSMGYIRWETAGKNEVKISESGKAAYENHLQKLEDEAYLKKYNEAILQEAIIANKKARNANIIAIVAGALAFLSLAFDLIQFLFS